MSVIEKCCLALLVFGGCTKTVSQCTKDSDCTTDVYPFCDVNGEYPASDGEHNVCTIVPPNCPVERCGCQPSAVTCVDSTITTCAADGKSVTTAACSLGCNSTDNRCFSFKPSNDLDAAMGVAAGETDVMLAASVTIDTDACDMHDSTNLAVDVKSLTVSQTSGPGICVFVANSFDITNAVVTGERALAFVAPGPVTLHGLIDEAARKRFQGSFNDGPGAVTLGASVGLTDGTESGGGGNATQGGDGLKMLSVPQHVAGGLAQTNFSPLMGGGQGGDLYGGGGGGALQIDSFTEIHLDANALLAFGGAGGSDGFGGGAGGTIVFEAPSVRIEGRIAANGGGGGYSNTTCPADGDDATNDDVPAAPGQLTCGAGGSRGGAGGTATVAPQNGTTFGGGGGSVGRILIRTADATFMGSGSLFSIVQTLDQLQKI